MGIVIKVTETSNTGLPNSYNYNRKCARVVVCEKGKKGLLSENGTRVLWESAHYNPSAPKTGKSKRAKALAVAQQKAKNFAATIGVELE